MRAIIMAGGQGSRLKSVTGDMPKPMAKLNGSPILEHILLLLKNCGIKDVCISLHYRPEDIMDYFGSGESLGINIEYNIESTPLGTAGGVKACSSFFGDREFLVISGDCACDFDLRQLMEAHRRHRPSVTMALYAHPRPLQYGVVLTDSRGRVVSFTEKPSWGKVISDMINTGIYIISPEAMELVPRDKSFDFSKDLFPLLLKNSMEIRALPMQGYWCDIGTPRAYHQCNLDALDGKLRLYGEEKAPPAGEDRTEERVFEGCRRELPCRSRAHLMHLVSQYLMEFGADFSDGISLDTYNGKVHISPSAKNESIYIDVDASEPDTSAAIAQQVEELVKNMDSEC